MLVSPKFSEFHFKRCWFRSRSRDFCQIVEGFGFGFENFGFGKKSRFRFRKSLVSVSVSENLVSEEKYRFRFRKNLVSEKSLGFGKFGVVKKISVSVSVKILVSSFSDVEPCVFVLVFFIAALRRVFVLKHFQPSGLLQTFYHPY